MNPCWKRLWLALALAVPLTAVPLAAAPAAGPIRALANDPIVVGESPDPATTALYTPSIVALPGGRLVASHTQTNRIEKHGQTFILTSDDAGRTWTRRASSPTNQGRLFLAGDSVYYLATRFYIRPGSNPKGEPLCIQRSRDRGETWSDPSNLDARTWHQTAANFWRTRGHVYLVSERLTTDNIRSWYVGALAPVLLRARETDDLTRPEAWTYASELTFQDLIPGYRENRLGLDYFGVPFFRQSFPRSTPIGRGENFPPIGWLETNVVQIVDPDHVWYDPQGRTFHLLARAHTGMTNYAALAKVTENADGTMTTSLEKAPSGKTLLFLPMPGGHMRFHVVYDAATKLYWMVGSQSTDSMTQLERLPKDRYGRGDNERHRMVLHFSRNLVDWCFAGLVATGATPKQSRHYAGMDIDGDDLVILSRSGDARASSAHDGNLITLHRVRAFRQLVY
jgi:hypothetical protein